MAKSLAEQLLGAGLVDQKKVNQAKQEKRLQAKHVQQGKVKAEPSLQEEVARQRADKAERDRKLNEQRVAQEHAKALVAQVRQMLQHSKQEVAGEISYRFVDPRNRKVKTLHVTPLALDQLAAGRLVICADGEQFVVVPRNAADKIAERVPEAVIFIAQKPVVAPAEDDPYKDYQIPDDLMW